MNVLADVIVQSFIPAGAELRALMPEMWLIGGIVAVLAAAFAVPRRNAASGLAALAGLIGALVSAVIVMINARTVVALHGMFVIDPAVLLYRPMLFLFVAGVIVLWFATTSASMPDGDGAEFFTLLLGATLGMSLMGSAGNLLMIFMAIELASLPSYVLAGFRKTNRRGAEASLKYVLFGAAASAIMAYGLSLLYGIGGSLQLDAVGAAIARGEGSPILLTIALAGVIGGAAFKIAAVPFHFWCPDVFEGASIEVSAFLSVASKAAGLMLLLRILSTLAAALPHQGVVIVATIIGSMGAITATVGNASALIQENIKRLLAYSSIAHAGYMLCAASLLLTLRDPLALHHAISAVLAYLAIYLFMNLGAFTVAAVVTQQTGGETLDDFAGLARRSPLLAAAMGACLLSLIGLPPFAGFLAKVNLMYVLSLSGGAWWALVAVIGLNTILSVYYYARVLRVMYLQPSDRAALRFNPLGTLLAGACAVSLLLLLIGFGPLQTLANRFGTIQTDITPVSPLTADVRE